MTYQYKFNFFGKMKITAKPQVTQLCSVWYNGSSKDLFPKGGGGGNIVIAKFSSYRLQWNFNVNVEDPTILWNSQSNAEWVGNNIWNVKQRSLWSL